MSAALRIVFLLALVVWVGEIVFLSFVVAPAAFQTLEREVAGRFVSVVFPRYYALGAVAGLAMVASAVCLGIRGVTVRARWFVAAGLAGGMLLMTLYASVGIQGRMDVLRAQMAAAARDSGALARSPGPERAEFDRLHGRAVLLNGLTLGFGLGVLGVAASALKE